ncbi:MAG: hypothetical protein HY898_10255 [Deltaproteobacteria bacterium]|nr:hypothetical protein [Deltaproteobacteria bacterium]
MRTCFATWSLLLLMPGCFSEGSSANAPWHAPLDASAEASGDAAGETSADAAGPGEGGKPDADGSVFDALIEAGPAPVMEHVTVRAGGVSAQASYLDAYDNVAGGSWYRDDDNETALLAWGESYVMASLASMFRATSDPLWLDRLAFHADGVLAQRDDKRGVKDYRGVSGACWRNLSYQPNQEPYCYAVHSGMIAAPLVEFALLVQQQGLDKEKAYDNATFGDKASQYLAAAELTAAYHDDEWNDAGYYVFRGDATFLTHAGKDQPLNQSNAMGRLLLLLHDATSKAVYLSRATKLLQRFKAQITTGSSGEYLWNYWGGTYASPGEDISHAAINVDFAVMGANRSVVFTDADVEALSLTFLGPVIVDDGTLSDFVGGGSTNGDSYRPQIGRWLSLAAKRTGVYTAVRDLYEQDYPGSKIGSGSLLLSWALLAEYEPLHSDAFFYSVDWSTADANGWREATDYGANILTTPADVAQSSVIVLPVDVPRPTRVQQWDGAAYHTVATWRATSGAVHRWVPYEPRWPFVYWNSGILFQFDDTFAAGDGIRVQLVDPPEPLAFASTPPTSGTVGQPIAYVAVGTGKAPHAFTLTDFPIGARIDAAGGQVTWTPPHAGDFPFTVRLRNDYGFVEQKFVVHVQ